MKIVWYSVEVDDHEERHSFYVDEPVCIERPREAREVAADCADHFWYARDGWECQWPLEFRLYSTEDGPEVARCSVDMEHTPHFTAYEVKP